MLNIFDFAQGIRYQGANSVLLVYSKHAIYAMLPPVCHSSKPLLPKGPAS